MKTGEINKNDSKAYYPRYDPALHPKIERKIQSFYQNRPDVYDKDRRSYYGPSSRYQVINTNPHQGKKVKVIMRDLSEYNPNKEKIKELQMQLNNLNNFIYLPKYMMRMDKNRQPYYADPNAYYDPTRSEINRKRRELKNTINRMKANLSAMELEKRAMATGEKTTNPLGYEKVQGKIFVENRENSKSEAYNDYIKNMIGEVDSQLNQQKTITAPLRHNESKNYQNPTRTENINKKNTANSSSTTIKGITFSTIASNYDITNNIKTKEFKNGKIYFLIFIHFFFIH
jgi:hypothetical protein